MPDRKAQSYFPNTLLKQARLERGLSQKQLADMIEAPQTFMVSRWENGVTIPGPVYRGRLCELFGKSCQDLGLPELPSLAHPYDPQLSLFDPSIPLHISAMRKLIGRDDLSHQIKKRLIQEHCPFLALHGLPGAGKTALSVSIACDEEIQQHFADGILWIGLGQKPQVFTHLSRLGLLLKLHEKERASLRTHTEWLQALRQLIGQRRMLIVIDDVWNLEDAASYMIGGPYCSYLLTTRLPEVAVRFAETHVWHIPELSQEEGEELLHSYMPTLIEQETPFIAQLVQAVGGLPLALSLIGSYLLTQTYHQRRSRVQMILTQLQQAESRFSLEHPQTALIQDPRLPIDKPLSIYSVIHLSETLLDASSRRALAALSLLPAKPDTFAEETALFVTNSTLETLDHLVASGLLEVVEGERYQLHQIVSDYANLYLKEPEAKKRIATYFCQAIQAHQNDHAWIEQEMSTMLRALQIAFTQELSDAIVQGIFSLTQSLFFQGLYELAQNLLNDVAFQIRQTQQTLWITQLLEQQGKNAISLGQYKVAEQVWQEGLCLAEGLQHTFLTSTLLYQLGELCYKQGHYASSEQYLKRNLELAYQTGTPQEISRTLYSLGAVTYQRGEYAAAQAYLHEGLTFAQQTSDARTITFLINIGAVEADQSHFEEADEAWQKALAYARNLGDRRSICVILVNLGTLSAELRKYAQAQAYLQEGLELARRIQHREQMCNVLLGLGELALQQNTLPEGEAYIQEGLLLAQQIGNPWFVCNLRQAMGELYLKRQEPQAALSIFSQALKEAPDGSRKETAKIYFGLARAYALLSKPQQAREYACNSLQCFTDIGYYRANEVQLWLDRFIQEDGSPQP
ncbi:NB-ARC domain-containing protein [Ktedonospora formicarum]|uniref:HTH cro/C1-type domain-containing protein n=1 Tax=Ktedonospora formicarum TaxID=2778364 RepID=A0A8J3IAR6_9CHLR|nr:NB-ARC domain-containing protein [Ktedonospora formicarum]GHO49890.1 hypothetical protein KSX_80530 [Ktedonospora formicarum]